MNESIKGLIAYIFGWIGGLIILFGFKDSEKLTRFHASQAITASVIYILIVVILGFIPYVFYINYLLSLAYLAFAVFGCIKSYNLEEFEVPVISDLTRKIFGNLIEG